MNQEIYNQMCKVAARGDYLLKGVRPQLNKSLEEHGRTPANKPMMQILSGAARKNNQRYDRGVEGLRSAFKLTPEDASRDTGMQSFRSEVAGDFWKDRRKKQGL